MTRRTMVLAVCAIWLVGATAHAAPHKDRHVLILGVDGLMPSSLKYYLESRAGWVRQHRDRGVLHELLGSKQAQLVPKHAISSFPSYTWTAWASIFTGHPPAKHGVMGQYFLLRDKGLYYDADRKIMDGPAAFGYQLDERSGEAVLRRAIGSMPADANVRACGKEVVALINSMASKKFRRFSLAKALGDLKPVGHSFATYALQVPTLYDYAFNNGLSTFNVFNFYHRKGAPAGVPNGFARPDKDTFLRFGLANEALFGTKKGRLFMKALGIAQAVRKYTPRPVKWIVKTAMKVAGIVVSPITKLFGPLIDKIKNWSVKKIVNGFKSLVRHAPCIGQLSGSQLRGVASALAPVVRQLMRYAIAVPKLGAYRHLNKKARGDAHFDEVSVATAISLVEDWSRRRAKLPNIFNVYVNAPDACSHKTKGNLRDIQVDCLAFVDHQFKKLIETIRAKYPTAWKKTMVVLVSDHGHTQLKLAGRLTARLADIMWQSNKLGRCDFISSRNGNMAHIYLQRGFEPLKGNPLDVCVDPTQSGGTRGRRVCHWLKTGHQVNPLTLFKLSGRTLTQMDRTYAKQLTYGRLSSLAKYTGKLWAKHLRGKKRRAEWWKYPPKSLTAYLKREQARYRKLMGVEAVKNADKCNEVYKSRTRIPYHNQAPSRDAVAVANNIIAGWKRQKVTQVGFALLLARGRDNKYRVFAASRARRAFYMTWKNGISLADFKRSYFKKAGFWAPIERIAGVNNLQRSGDLLFVGDAERGFGFSGSPATHGGLQTGDSLFTLRFFGPAVDGRLGSRRVALRTTYQWDITPTILRFLGVDMGKRLTGRALFDGSFRPLK